MGFGALNKRHPTWDLAPMFSRLSQQARRWAPLIGAALAILFALAVEAEAARHEFRNSTPTRYGPSGTGHVL